MGLIGANLLNVVDADVDLANAETNMEGSGIGRHRYKTWIVPIDKYDIGSEQIQHSKIEVIDGDLGEGSEGPGMGAIIFNLAANIRHSFNKRHCITSKFTWITPARNPLIRQNIAIKYSCNDKNI